MELKSVTPEGYVIQFTEGELVCIKNALKNANYNHKKSIQLLGDILGHGPGDPSIVAHNKSIEINTELMSELTKINGWIS